MEILLITSDKHHERPLNFQDQYEPELLDQQAKQLGLKIQSGKDQEQDKREIYYILNRLLSYPSTQLAKTHRKSNRLGLLDINKEQRYRRISDIKFEKQQDLTEICKCCGFILQEKELTTCTHAIENISNVGISTYLYFKTIFNVSILLAIMLIVYSAYSLATNIKASNIQINGNYSSTALKFLSISLGSKQLYASEQKKTMYVIGAWIGCGMLLLWGVAFLGLKYYQKESEVAILLQSKSVSEFSLVIENIPTGITKDEIQRQFKDYLKRVKETQQVSIDKLQVVKYNEGQPFYFNQDEFDDEELKRQLEMTKQYKVLFTSWIEQRKNSTQFKKSKKFRHRKYKQYARVIERKAKIVNELNQTIKEQYKQKNRNSLTTVFVTFASNHQKNFVLDHNPDTTISKIKDFLPCFKNTNRFFIKREDQIFDLRILPAPDPEDIVWNNIGVSLSEKVGRKFLTYSISATILAISFVITYSLSSAKALNESNQILSTIISLSIAIINLIIGQVIQFLTSYERDYTMTNYQISLAIKSVFAQLINSIFIPIIAGYFIKQNIYGENGLIEDIFILGIANSVIYPLAKIINPSYYLRYVYALYKLIPANKLGQHQFQINELYQKLQFEVGYEYIYIVNLFIFTAFFVSLQPILPIFALLGLFLIYWIMKYTLYHRCQRPVPGTPIINTTVSQMIYFAAIAYTLGSMTWANFLPQSQFEDALVPNLIALGLACIIFLVPYQTIFRAIFSKKRMPQIWYNQTRIFFTSEYDRLNPSTSQAGVKEYFNFLQNKIKELQGQSDIFKSRLSFQLELANRPNFYKQPSNIWITATKYDPRHVVENLVRKQSQNVLTPQLIASIINKQKHTKVHPMLKSRVQQSLAKLQPARKLFRRQTEQKQFRYQKHLRGSLPQNEDTKHYLKDLQKIESVDMHDMGRTAKLSINNEREQQSIVYNQYFKQIQNVRSFILKTDSLPVPPEQQKTPPILNSEFSFNKQRIEHESAAKQPQEYKSMSFRDYMRGDEVECMAQVPNRFSINSNNILPLCIDSQRGKETLWQSQIRFCNLACFQ